MRRLITLFASIFVFLAGCEEPGPVIEPPEEASLVRFDPDGEGFYRIPWPSDARLTAAGTPDMTGFPGGRPVAPPLAEIEARVSGFATMPVVYFALTAPVSDDALPQGLEAMEPDSPIQMIDLSEEGCGRRLPLEIAFAAEGDSMRDDNMLQVANAVGTVLTPRTPYGVIVLESFGDDAGPTERPAAFDRALNDTTGADALSRSLEPLRRCLPSAGVALDDVAVATVFTTQDPIGEMQTLRDFVMDPERLETRAVGGWQMAEAWSRRRLSILTYSGTIELPIFQDGETPYERTGGGLVLDADGQPVVQRWESVDVAIAARTFETPPEGPRPVLVFMDGTGWTPWGHLSDNWISEALDAGYVVMSFMPQFHGGRAGFEGNTETTTFNLVNPSAVRTTFRQEAAEISYFIRLIRERIAGLPGLPPLDTERLVYGGHSQGALCGAIVAAVEDQFEAYVFSGLSSYLTFTVLHREDIVDFAAVVSAIYRYRGTLDRFSPLLQMMQMGGEVVDPHNYVRRWHGWAENPDGNHVFVSNGLADATTTPRGMEHMTMAADMPPLAPPGWEVDPVGVWDREPVSLPVSGNEVALSGGALTIATYLDPTQGHGTIYRRPFVRELAVGFWDSARAGTPTLSSRSEYQCGDGADDDVDGMFDCADPDCASTAPCVEGACDNGVDEDDNGMTDCADPVCASAAACQERACDDGDDDGDGAADCADPDCARRAPCAEQICDDGMDDDGDGDVDCADTECASAAVCHETRCTDGLDNDRDGAIDCADSECLHSSGCPERACTGGTDEDDDGLTDCADPDCASATECARTAETMCGNGADDDDDGAIDCADADCGATTACAAATCADATLGSQLGVALFTGTLDGAGNDYPPGDCVAFGAGAGTPDVALEWTAPAAGEYVISTRGSEVDTVLHVLGATCEPASELACDDDDSPLVTSEVAVTLEEGQTVVIVVSGYDAAEDAGAFTLHIHARR